MVVRAGTGTNLPVIHHFLTLKHMRLHIPKIMALSVGLLCATGCKQDLLEQVNPNAPGTETFFTTAENAERSILAAYSSLQQIGTYSRWLHFATVLRADEGFSSSPWGELADFTRFLQSNYNFEPSEVTWQDHYRGIFRTNQIITNLERQDVQIDESVERQVLAEARFIRALLYFNLASLYGNVPLAVLPSTISYRPEQATEQQVWDQVIADLTAAKGNLPVSYPNANNLGRATRGAAQALLGKAYMQLRRYPDAVRELGELVNSNRYSLAPNYLDNFTETSENNSESIFEVQFSSALEGGEQDQSSASEGSNRAQFFGPPGNGFSDGEARKWLYDEFLLERTASGGIDPRLDVTLFHNHHENLDPARPKLPGDTLVYGTGFNVRYPYGTRNNTRLFWRKYQTDRTRSSENFHSPINHRVIRYADVLLLYAEALNESNQTAAAFPFVNQVRQRVGLRTLEQAFPGGLTQPQMRMQIMHERALELAGEGPRWYDLRRWQPWSTPAGLQELIRRDPDFVNFTPGKELLPLLRTDVDISGYTQNEAWR